MMPADRHHRIADKSAELVEVSVALWSSVNPHLQRELRRLVVLMNCYYSNLIEGHPTHPIEIEKAMRGNLSDKPKKRNLQLEARAHVEVDELISTGQAPSPVVSAEFLKWVHKAFYERLPDDLHWTEPDESGHRLKIIPGAFREAHVRVGGHIAPSPDDIDPLIARWAGAYQTDRVARIYRCAAVAAAHHRLLWIHPFLDGNGRVARLLANAMLREMGVPSELWSVSRGLGRHVEEYKAALAFADDTRRGDLDGRGNLTDEGLEKFCEFFLDVCKDQVTFMHRRLQPGELANRMEIWCEEEMRQGRVPKGSWPLLKHALFVGQFTRGEAAALTGYEVRQARTVLNALIGRGVLVSPTPRSAVTIGIPAEVVERWLPSLYPAVVSA